MSDGWIKNRTPSKAGRGKNGRIWTKEIVETTKSNYYIPSDGMCLLKCINKILQLLGSDAVPSDVYNEFCITYKIHEDIFPLCKVGVFLDFLDCKCGISISLYKYNRERKQTQKIREKKKYGPLFPFKFVLLLQEEKEFGISHYCLMWKREKEGNLSFLSILEEIEKKEWIQSSDLKKLNLDVTQIAGFNQVCSDISEQLKNVYVWDCETYWEDCTAVAFACAAKRLDIEEGKESFLPVEWVGDKYGESPYCINQMIDWLDKQHAHEKISHGRVHINLYAHNSRGFDSYIVLKTPGLKFKSIIKSNCNIL